MQSAITDAYNGFRLLGAVSLVSMSAAKMLSHPRIGPLRLLSRWLDYARAVGYVTVIAARKAWETAIERWPEALHRARLER